jgi:alginate O-acetyltransferase complex protein AlgI
LSGLWHGAALNFVLWGLYQGTLLVLERLFWLDVQKKLPTAVNIAFQFFLTMIGWVIFRCESIDQIGWYLTALFRDNAQLPSEIVLNEMAWLTIGVGLILSFGPAFPSIRRAIEWFEGARYRDELLTASAILLFALSAGRIAGATFSPFLYFRF